MTDFDKLIKEKAEQATYSYHSADWKSFQRKAGMRSGAWKYWVAGASSIVAIGGIVLSTMIGKDTPQVPSETESCLTVRDTALSVLPEESFVCEDTVSVNQVPPAHTGVHALSHSVSKDNVDPSNEPSVVSSPTEMPKKQQTLLPRHGRPLVIDVDTIKENVPTDEELRKGNSRLFE